MHESIHELKTRKHIMAFPWAWRWKSGQLQNESSRKGTSASNLMPPHHSWQGESPPLAEVRDMGMWHITGHEAQPCPGWGCSPRAHPCHPITQKCWGLQPTHVPGLLQSTGGRSWNHKAALRPHLASCTRGVWKVDFYVVILNVFLCWSTVGRLCMSSPDDAFSQRCPRASIYL